MAGGYDFLIVGGGIAGASVAASLAASHRVAVLEREFQPGYHSTGRSAALFSTIYGSALVRALSQASRDFLYRPPAGFADVELVKPRGVLFIAPEQQLATLNEFAAKPDVAAAAQRLSKRAVLEKVPILKADFFTEGLYEPSAADLEVHALHQGFLRAVRARGGHIVSSCRIDGIHRQSRDWLVETNVGRFRAPTLINAAGAWADEVAQLAGAGALGLQPCRRTAVLIDLPEGTDAHGWPITADIHETFYFKPDAGLLLISPADATPSPPCDAQPDELDIAIAVDRFEAATTMSVRRVRQKWAGLRSFFADRDPIAGFDQYMPGFFWLAGQGGYGIQTAPALARSAAALARFESLPADISALGITEHDLSPARLSSTSSGARLTESTTS
jgi:D-arginine dehydrogenase